MENAFFVTTDQKVRGSNPLQRAKKNHRFNQKSVVFGIFASFSFSLEALKFNFNSTRLNNSTVCEENTLQNISVLLVCFLYDVGVNVRGRADLCMAEAL